jgi:hypothetical protein
MKRNLHFGAEYTIVRALPVTRLAHDKATALDDPILKPDTRIRVLDWSEWQPHYSEQMKASGVPTDFYVFQIVNEEEYYYTVPIAALESATVPIES